MKEVDEWSILEHRRLEDCEIKEIVRELNEHLLSSEEIKQILSKMDLSDIRSQNIKHNHVEEMSISSPEHSISCCDSTKLMSVLEKLEFETNTESNLESIADEFSKGLAKTESRIIYWNLDDSILEVYPRIESKLHVHRHELEGKVRKKLNLTNSHQEIRLGIVDNRIYLWKPDKAPNDMINVWGKSYFYFNPSNLDQILLETSKHLGFHGNEDGQLRHLNKIVEQTISMRPCDRIRSKNSKFRMLGNVLHLQCDILGISPRDIEDKIERVAGKNGHGGIFHPKLLRGTELEMIRARLGAIVNSDCWLGDDGRLFYTEADKDRMRIVESLFLQFGEMTFKIVTNNKNKSHRMWIPKPLGNAFLFWGFTSGDKPVQNTRLSEVVRDGPLESYVAYLEDLISEDGSFDHVNGFRWSRTIVLKLGTKDTNYVMNSKLSDDAIDFLFKFEEARRYRGEVYVPITRLEREMKNHDELAKEIINQILDTVKENRCRLLDDEASLASKLGIEIQISPELITLYKESGRISLKWVATTKRKDDAIKWALIASPNDPRKNGLVQDWFSLIPDDVGRIKKLLRNKV